MKSKKSTPVASTIIPIMAEDIYFHHFSLSKDETNTAIITRMRKLSVEDSSIAHKFARNIRDIILIRQPAVGTGLVLKVSTLWHWSRLGIDSNFIRQMISKLRQSPVRYTGSRKMIRLRSCSSTPHRSRKVEACMHTWLMPCKITMQVTRRYGASTIRSVAVWRPFGYWVRSLSRSYLVLE